LPQRSWRRPSSAGRYALVWVAINVAGLSVYLWLASSLWVLPGEEGQPGGPGDAFYWFFVLVPILVGFLVANLIVLFVIIRRARVAPREWIALLWWLVAVALWVGAIAYDQHRSVRHVDPRYSWATIVRRA
jgi:hypothetical protein